MKKVIVRVRCPKCEKGEMLSTGNGFSNSAGSWWEHRCDQCGHRKQLSPGESPREFVEYEPHETEERWETTSGE